MSETTTPKATAASLAFHKETGLASVHPYEYPVLKCDDCGCLFTPDDDGTAYYPDRFAVVGSDPTGSHRHDDDDCACHALAYSIEYDR